MRKSLLGYLLGTAGVALVVVGLLPLREHINTTPVALAFLLVVLFTAATYGSYPAFAVSILASLSFNFFFTQPYHTFIVTDSQNWIALIAFLLTAFIAGSLSARERRRAEEAETRRKESERLYIQLQSAFERASEAEAFKRSERLKSALLDAVTHHFRTPLTSMKAAATTLLAEGLNMDQEGKQELLEIIDSEADRLNGFVESLIEIARIEAGQMDLHLRVVSIEEIIANAMHHVSRQLSNHKVQVKLKDQVPSIRVDAASMSEVISILLDNAAKYSPSGTTLHIEVTQDKMDDLLIIVEDQGSGIPLEFHQRIFDKFFRIENDKVGKRDGLGMGLAIARGIVEAHGGRIWAEAGQNNKGTRIIVKIPSSENMKQETLSR